VLDTWQAEGIHTVLEGGRTRPLVLQCSRETPTDADEPNDEALQARRVERRLMVVKALGLPEVRSGSLFNEAFGNLLARELGVATPAPALVSLSSEFVRVAAERLGPLGIELQAGMGIGCEFFAQGFANVESQARLTQEELKQAAKIYALDLLIQNIDRRPEKPNCARLADRFVAYDFEMAFSFLLAIGQKEPPWHIANLTLGSNHLFYASLRASRSKIDWAPIEEALATLSPERMRNLASALPDEWKRNLDRVIEHVAAIRSHASEFVVEIEKSLA
jgi:hypothetical protein